MTTTISPSGVTTRLCADSISLFKAHLLSRGYSAETVRGYCADLSTMISDMVGELDHEYVEKVGLAWLNLYRRQRAPKTILRRVTSLRAYCNWADLPDYFASYRCPTPKRSDPHPLPEGQEGVRLMCEAAKSARHAALFALCGYCGTRVSEALSLRTRDVDVDRMCITVRGKGDKTRIVPVSTRAWEYIREAYYQAKDDPLNGKRIVPLPGRTARDNIERVGKRVLRHSVPSHDLRSTFGTELYRRTKDLRLVQELLGHASPDTTVSYTLVGIDAQREAVNLL